MKQVRLLVFAGVLTAALFFGGFRSAAAAASCYIMGVEVGYVCDSNPPLAEFVPPPPVANSILDRLNYGRISDMANVYAAPSLGSEIVRNAGDGYLWASISDIANNHDEGSLWYSINPGEWVRAEEFKPQDASDFTGFEVRAQPDHIFGWMVVDFPYSLAPGEEPPADAVKLPRYTPVTIYDAVVAEDGWIWYDIGHGRWMRQTYMSLLDVSPRPEEIGEDEYWVEVDLYEQTFAAYEGDRMVYAGLVSSGENRWPTNEGLFQVWERHQMTDMVGAEGKVDYYWVEDVPHTMYFDFDIALHGAYWHDRFGYKHSHGCVNMPPRDAEWVFNWSTGAPNDLWVWVHTSDPHSYVQHVDVEGGFSGP